MGIAASPAAPRNDGTRWEEKACHRGSQSGFCPWAERPEDEIGLSSEGRLERATAKIKEDVERGLIPGAVLAIARGGRVGYAEATIGYRDREAGAPMALDLISPHRLDDQADGLGRGDDAGRGGAASIVGAPVAEYIPRIRRA